MTSTRIITRRLITIAASIAATAACTLTSLTSLTSCYTEVGPTWVHIPDSVRHYYPVVMGDKIKVTFWVENHGEYPLVIDEIQPSCGCIQTEDNRETYGIIPVGKRQKFNFLFDSSKNIGEVEHTIRVFGNLVDDGMAEMQFNVNIMPSEASNIDYEANYYAEQQRENAIKGIIDGTAGEKGYYIEDQWDHDSRSYDRYPWSNKNSTTNASGTRR